MIYLMSLTSLPKELLIKILDFTDMKKLNHVKEKIIFNHYINDEITNKKLLVQICKCVLIKFSLNEIIKSNTVLKSYYHHMYLSNVNKYLLPKYLTTESEIYSKTKITRFESIRDHLLVNVYALFEVNHKIEWGKKDMILNKIDLKFSNPMIANNIYELEYKKENMFISFINNDMNVYLLNDINFPHYGIKLNYNQPTTENYKTLDIQNKKKYVIDNFIPNYKNIHGIILFYHYLMSWEV